MWPGYKMKINIKLNEKKKKKEINFLFDKACCRIGNQYEIFHWYTPAFTVQINKLCIFSKYLLRNIIWNNAILNFSVLPESFFFFFTLQLVIRVRECENYDY